MVARDVAGVGTIRNFIFGQTPLKSHSCIAPHLVFAGVDVLCCRFNVHIVVPVKQIVLRVISLLQVVANTLLMLFLNVELVVVVIA